MARKKHTKKRPNGEGSVYRRGETGPWIAALTVGPKQRITRTRHTKAEAEAALAELLLKSTAGMLTATAQTPLGQYLWDWLENVKRPNVRPASFIVMRRRIKIVAQHLGTIPLAELGPQHIQRFYRTLMENYTPRTIGQVHIQLKSALRHAVEWEFIARNPCDRVKPPKIEQREYTTLSPEDLANVLDELREHRLYALYVLLMHTGLRGGEALGLRWADINEDLSVLHVRQIVTPLIDGGMGFGPPKTESSRRTVRLVPEVIAALKRHEQQQRLDRIAAESWRYPDLVFTSPSGGILWRRDVGDPLSAALTRLGLPHLRVHDLRHCFATALAHANVQPQTLQRILGHSNVQTTLGIYAHVLKPMEVEAMEVMGTALKRRTK
jgi:integrase